MIAIEVDERNAELLLGRKLNALDRFLGLATDRGIKLVMGNLRGRLKLLKRPQNVQDAPGRTLPRTNPVSSRREGADGVVELRPHLTSARSPVVQALYKQLGLEKDLVRKGLWIDTQAYLRDFVTGRFQGRRRGGGGGYKSRAGLTFLGFEERVSVGRGFGFSATARKKTSLIMRRDDLRTWAQDPERGTQMLRHTVRLAHPDILTKLLTAPTVKFCRARIVALFETATRQAMEQ